MAAVKDEYNPKGGEIVSEQLWKATLTCHDCGAVVNTAENVPQSKKAIVSLTSGMNTGKCPNGCRSTFKDLNINTDLKWELQI